ncbi:hypothetical protein THTE_4437 [Thermogutta terrifontis]|uniref:Uncharacterized protein n=1 Tax=Thermogutta terrifontis TaxID=1331910 RepID=A0A286RM42_9BACT|nr:hypothetical protein [Thermogutta terrifontis]ASV77038.1 hypothetical protein THTE_4437 [Thermogutta terrifontis]
MQKGTEAEGADVARWHTMRRSRLGPAAPFGQKERRAYIIYETTLRPWG